MLQNYIKVALRNIRKQRAFSFINIFGLAVAMSICMGIIMLVADQMMVDRHNTHAERVYRINSIPYYKDQNGESGSEFSTTTLPIRDELLNNYTGVAKAVRLMRGFGNNWIEFDPENDINVPVSGFFADPDVLEVFDLELLYGDRATALVDPYSLVLTKKTAEKIFKVENPVGESLKVGDLGIYKITGVIKDTDNRSHIVSDAYASMATVKSLEAAHTFKGHLDDWNNLYQGWVYVMLEEGETAEDIRPSLEKISKAHSSLAGPNQVVVEYVMQNLLDIVPGRGVNNPIGPSMPWLIVYFLSGLAAIILVTSCFNFTNLSIARSLNRAREIGVRKVTGATRWQLFVQFISESVIICLFAMILAVMLVYILRPFIEEIPFASVLKWNLSANYFVFGAFLILAVVIGIIAGLFPAAVLSGFQPISVLKDLGNTKLISKVGLRKALLVAQFSLSMIFILTVIVLYNQLNLYLHSDQGFTVSNKLVIQKGEETNMETLKNELLKQPNITNVSAASHLPMVAIKFGEDVKRSFDEKQWRNMSCFYVDENYLENMGLTLVAGKFFSPEDGGSNANFIVINEATVVEHQFKSAADAVGQTLILGSDSTQRQIIGVVKDYHFDLFSGRLESLSLMNRPDKFALLQVEYTGDFQQASNTVKQVWSGVNPSLKLEVKDFRKEIGMLYDLIMGTLVKVLGFIALLAIIISCLGLLGMATYTIETRKKEIAIRKVLGSSNNGLVFLLSKGYISILLLALAIAVPISYFMNTFWLQLLANHVTVDVWTIGIGVFVLAFFGLLTIGSQMIQATRINPVENLKNE
jgi:putative ABC transport system permease protein